MWVCDSPPAGWEEDPRDVSVPRGTGECAQSHRVMWVTWARHREFSVQRFCLTLVLQCLTMRSITVKVTDEQYMELQARAAQSMGTTGGSISAVIREAIEGWSGGGDQLEDHERRIGRLEEMAGL